MNLYQKLVEIRKGTPYLKKENRGAQYNYVKNSQAVGAIKDKMNELGVLLIPSVVGASVTHESVDWTDKGGKPKRTTTYFTEVDMMFRWVDADDPGQFIDCPWYAQGVDIAGEKGVGKAYTYAEKYFILKFFNVPTDSDDPDEFQRKVESAKPEALEPITEEQCKHLGTIISKNGRDLGKFLEYAGVQDLAEIPQAKYTHLCSLIESKKK